MASAQSFVVETAVLCPDLFFFFRSSVHDIHEHDLESDQSILDEHVDRVFNEDKAHNVSAFNQFDSSNNRHISTSFNMGYRTLDTSRQHHHHQSHFGKSISIEKKSLRGRIRYFLIKYHACRPTISYF